MEHWIKARLPRELAVTCFHRTRGGRRDVFTSKDQQQQLTIQGGCAMAVISTPTGDKHLQIMTPTTPPSSHLPRQ